MPEIIITIDEETGEVTLEGVGFEGKACDAAMAPFEEALGKKKERRNKPEYNRQVKQTRRA